MTEYNITCVCVMTWQSEHLGGPGRTSGGAFLPAKILSKAIDFERPGGREWLPSGTPFQKFYTFSFIHRYTCVYTYFSFILLLPLVSYNDFYGHLRLLE